MGMFAFHTIDEINNMKFESFKRGDERGLSYFHTNYYSYLLRYAFNRCNDSFISESVVQDGFLKVWDYRERIQTQRHLFCFVRLYIRWKIIAHYKSNKSRYHFRTHLIESPETLPIIDNEDDTTITQKAIDESNLQLIRNVLKYLPIEKQSIVKQILDCKTSKEIKLRYGVSRFSDIIDDVSKHLRPLLNGQKLLSENRVKEPISNIESLDEKQNRIYTLRKLKGYSFSEICGLLDIGMNEAITCYSDAITSLKKAKENGQRKNYNYSKNTAFY